MHARADLRSTCFKSCRGARHLFPVFDPKQTNTKSQQSINNSINMKNSVLLAASFALIGFAAPARAYQVTGPILELTDTKIVVQKEKEKWEIARTAATKVTGELKVGSKVTIEYTMTAATIEAKPDKTPSALPAPPTPPTPPKPKTPPVPAPAEVKKPK